MLEASAVCDSQYTQRRDNTLWQFCRLPDFIPSASAAGNTVREIRSRSPRSGGESSGLYPGRVDGSAGHLNGDINRAGSVSPGISRQGAQAMDGRTFRYGMLGAKVHGLYDGPIIISDATRFSNELEMRIRPRRSSGLIRPGRKGPC